MKKLYLKLTSGGINSLGMDIVWNNPAFQFKGAQGFGVFDEYAMELQDGQQGRIILGAMNTNTREVAGTQEFAEFTFEWTAGSVPVDVDFSVENVSAKNGADQAIPVHIIVADYETEVETVIEFIWR